jgi:hypothetical protein
MIITGILQDIVMQSLSQSGKSFNINKQTLTLEQGQEASKGGIVMKTKLVSVFLLVLLTCVFAEAGSSKNNKKNGLFWPKCESEAAGGTEVMISPWTPGEGGIEPGAKIRGWTAQYQETLIGQAGDLASGQLECTMNCNLDDKLTGPCWGTFEITNDNGTWLGTFNGTFNFQTGAGSYKAKGLGQGGLKGMVLLNDVVYPGWAFSANEYGGSGFIYSTVIYPAIPGHHNSDGCADRFD